MRKAFDWKRGQSLAASLLIAAQCRTEELPRSTCSYFNVEEIGVIKKYVDQLLEDRFSDRKLFPKDIGIITPYRKQVRPLLLAVCLCSC
jgi:hypothetical protein